MELILWRHAEAEKESPELADIYRPLTVEGRKKARAAAKGITHYLSPKAEIEIWASPAKRSKETASFLADILGSILVKDHPAIYNGSLGELITEWLTSPADIIILVGHEPHLSRWAYQLANVILPFKKCAAAGFMFVSPEEATLTWFACPTSLITLGKRTRRVDHVG